MSPEAIAPPVELSHEAAEAAGSNAQSILASIGKEYVGDQIAPRIVLDAMLARGHALLGGTPGIGKTLLTKLMANAIGGTSGRVQCTNTLTADAFTGTVWLDPRTNEPRFTKGPVLTANNLLVDEANRATTKTLAGLLEAMGEEQVTLSELGSVVHPEPIPVQDPFMVLATQNTHEAQQGTNPLSQANIDRFLAGIFMSPMTKQDLDMIQERQTGGNEHPIRAERVLDDIRSFRSMQIEAGRVTLDSRLMGVISEFSTIIAHGAGEDSYSYPGGARTALGLNKMGRTHAYVAGRKMVSAQDLIDIAPYISAHRIDFGYNAVAQTAAQEYEAKRDIIDAALRAAFKNSGVSIPKTT